MPHPDDFDHVEAEVNLNIIDAVKLDEQAKLAQKATQIAKEAEVADKKLKRLGIRGGKVFPLAGEGRLGQIMKQKDPQGKMFGLFEERAYMQENLNKLENKLDKMEDSINKFSDMASNPMAFILNIFKKSAGLKTIMKMAGVIFATKIAYESVMGFVRTFFSPGSVFDIRKKVLEAVKSIPELKYLIDINNGSVFFTADTRLSQTAPTTSNMESMRNSHMRFNYFYLGDTIGSIGDT